MFIQTEQTPNPATLKFLPGQVVMATGTANFTDAAAARVSPLAERLFALPQLCGVFFGAAFATLTKSDAGDEEDDEIVSQIKELLETRVRPAVAQDCGGIIFPDFEDGVVSLHTQG